MRHTIVALSMVLAAGATTAAQTPGASEHPYGLDPYRPSDAFWLRTYGATLVAQTPLLELRKLDPYKPSHQALVRQIGGAIPLWGLAWYPAPPNPTPLSPFPTAAATGGSTTQNVVIVVPPSGATVPRRVPPPPFEGVEAGVWQQPPLSEALRARGLHPGAPAPEPAGSMLARVPREDSSLMVATKVPVRPGTLITGAGGARYVVVGSMTGTSAEGERRFVALVRRSTAP